MIISIHLRKCAGTTFRDTLSTAYGNRVLFDYGDEVGSNWPSSLAKRQKTKHEITTQASELSSKYSIIHGHFYRDKYDSIPDDKIYITFLRNPIQRLISNYLYLQRNEQRLNPDAYVVNKLGFSLEEYIEYDDNRNLQSQYLQSINLEGLDFVGITEHYSRSLTLLSNFLQYPLTEQVSRNVNPDKESSYAVSDDIAKRIIRNNEIDYQLYRLGLERLMRST